MRRRDARSAGPSAGDLRLRGELDSLRRQLSRLKKTVGAPEPVHTTPLDLDDAKLAPSTPAVAANDPVAEAAFAPRAEAEIDRLRAQVIELTSAKQRLSRLYFNQLEDNRKRQHRLRQLLESSRDAAGEPDVDAWLARFVRSIGDGLGFAVTQVWIRGSGGDLILRASTEAAQTPSRIKVDELRRILREEFRVGHSYFVSHGGRAASAPAGLASAEPSAAPTLEWRDEDVLHVPLFDGGQPSACLTLRRPKDGLVPSQEVVELLEIHLHIVATTLGIEPGQRLREAHRTAADGPDLSVRRLQMQFASTVAGAMRSPIVSLLAHLDALRGERDTTEADVRWLQSVESMGEETRRLSRLVESIRELENAGEPVPGAERIDLQEVAEETARLLGPLAGVADVVVKVVTDAADTFVVADRIPIRHLALCMGGHAVQRTPHGGVVTLRVAGDEAEIVFETIPVGAVAEGSVSARVPSSSLDADDLASGRTLAERLGGHLETSATGAITARLPRSPRPRVRLRPEVKSHARIEDVLGLGVEMVAEVMGARVVSVLGPGGDGDLVIHAALGLDDDVVRDTRIRPGTGVAGWVAQNRRPVCVSGAEERSDITGSGRDLYRSRTFLSVPVEFNGEPLGVLNVTDPVAATQFGSEDCHLLLQLAECIGAAWSRVMAARVGESGAHDASVALRNVLRHIESGRRRSPGRMRLARAIGRTMEIEDGELGAIGFAATVHELGLTRLESGDTPGTPRPLDILGDVRGIVLSQQEWWDGSGFPAGLKGEQIPRGGRILAVVNAFEAMTLDRGHREPMRREEALAELTRGAGHRFDPKVVEACVRALEEVESETAAVAGDQVPESQPTRGGD